MNEPPASRDEKQASVPSKPALQPSTGEATPHAPSSTARVDKKRAAHKPKLIAKLLRPVGVTLATLVLAAALIRVGLIPEIETVVRDAQMRLNHSRHSEVVLIRITDGDYDTLFENRSPLRADVIAALINAVARGNPAVIGIDLDTSAKSFSNLPRAIDPNARIVWARDAVSKDDGTLEPQEILGGNDHDAVSGLSVVPEDEDGIVRSYSRALRVKTGDRQVEYRGFAWAMVRDSGHRAEERNISDEPLEIRLARQRPGEATAHVELSAGQLLSPECSRNSKCSPAMDDDALKQLFAGKLVLVGGSYRAARDVHATPVGIVDGMDLIAQIVDTEIYGGGLPRRPWFIMAAVLLFENVVLVLIGAFWKPERRFFTWFMVCIVVSLIGSLICSWISFGTLLGMVFFLPVFCTVILLELYATARILRERVIDDLVEESGHSKTSQTTA